ncbi:MAG TPA: hypothetical protein VFG39_00130 [Balneolaceae bacterium]|nr:hypothetical protein [Balneolaceae bacterium]
MLLPSIALGQSLNLSVLSPTSNNSPSTFLLEDGEASINPSSFQFLGTGKTIAGFSAYGISPGYSLVSFLKATSKKGQLVLFDSSGDTLNSYSTISLSSADPSLAVYPSNAGSVLIRDNIVNFTFYNTFGEVITSMSSSGETKGGQVISEVAMSPNRETVVIYTPKIKRNGKLGSKAEVMLPNGDFETIYFSNDRILNYLGISESGNLIVAISSAQGTDQVLIMDKFGNELNTITSREDLIGASFSDNGEFITLYSDQRVLVFTTMTGERLGSTSFRSPVLVADYFPEDDVILTLTGDYYESTGIINDAEFRAVDLEQRELASEQFSGALGFNHTMKPKFVRSGSGEYKLMGASKRIAISVNF